MMDFVILGFSIILLIYTIHEIIEVKKEDRIITFSIKSKISPITTPIVIGGVIGILFLGLANS